VAKRKRKDTGLWIPIDILQCPDLTGDEKLLYGYFHSFQHRGCWQTNEYIAKQMQVPIRTLGYWMRNLKLGGFIVTQGSTSNRKIFSNKYAYCCKPAMATHSKSAMVAHCQSDCQKLPERPAKNASQVLNTTILTTSKNGPTNTYTNTIRKKTKKELLKEAGRRETIRIRTEQLGRKMGTFGGGRLSDAERERRRQEQKAALLA
jgi:hypothetical protein